MNEKKQLFLLFAVLVTSPAMAESELGKNPVVESKVCEWTTCVALQTVVSRQELPLRGLTPFRYWGFKVYVAALYAPASVGNIEESLGKVPMKLELHYYRSFSVQDFISSAQDVLEKNPTLDLKKLQPQIDTINRFYQAVNPGDSYALTYDPDTGLTLSLNGSPRGVVIGDDFARAYLGIWLSRYSLSPGLTKALTEKSVGAPFSVE
jgi:hypothetical protein